MILSLLFVACSGTTAPLTDGSTDTIPPDARSVEDVYVQDTLDPVDFIWVFDPTWTEGFEDLSSVRDLGYDTLRLAGTSFRMGMMTADVQNPASRGAIRGEHETIFPPDGTWALPTGEEFRPRPLDAILEAVGERFEANEDFFREDAHLHFMVLTDTQDRSEATVQRFTRLMGDLVDDGITESVRVSAIVSANQAIVNDWTALTDELGGITYNAGSWERGIETLYLHGINQRREFALTEFPIRAPSEVIVTFRNRNTLSVLGEDYDYIAARNRIRFIEEAPEVGSTIRIRYSVPNE